VSVHFHFTLPTFLLSSFRSMYSLLLLMLLCSVAVFASDDESHKTIDSVYRNMVSDWAGFKDFFSKNAVITVCWEGERCHVGSFADIYGTFQEAVSVYQAEHTILAGHYGSATLHHWSHYLETYNGCSASFTGYSNFEFEGPQVKRMVVYSDDSKMAMDCIKNYYLDDAATSFSETEL